MSDDTAARLSSLQAQLGRVILGKPEAIEHVIIALVAGHHLLMAYDSGADPSQIPHPFFSLRPGEILHRHRTPDRHEILVCCHCQRVLAIHPWARKGQGRQPA